MNNTHEPFALSPKDAARRLGIDVSTLWRHYGQAIHSGRVRSLKIGRARRIIWASLLAEVEQQSQGARRASA